MFDLCWRTIVGTLGVALHIDLCWRAIVGIPGIALLMDFCVGGPLWAM
jgi:hypothetical protein